MKLFIATLIYAAWMAISVIQSISEMLAGVRAL
jgi:hypothetical protein